MVIDNLAPQGEGGDYVASFDGYSRRLTARDSPLKKWWLEEDALNRLGFGHLERGKLAVKLRWTELHEGSMFKHDKFQTPSFSKPFVSKCSKVQTAELSEKHEDSSSRWVALYTKSAEN